MNEQFWLTRPPRLQTTEWGMRHCATVLVFQIKAKALPSPFFVFIRYFRGLGFFFVGGTAINSKKNG